MLLGQPGKADAKFPSLRPRPGAGWRITPLPFQPQSSSHSVSPSSHFCPFAHPCPLLASCLACLTTGPRLSLLHALVAPLAGRALREPAASAPHPSCRSLKLHPWVTRHGAEPLPSEDENCTLVEVTEEEVENSVKHIPSLATVVRQMDP